MQPLEHHKGKGLYVPELEKDACGTGLIANLDGQASHLLIQRALEMLGNMKHRGASGYEANTGDGAGLLTRIDHDFFAQKCKALNFSLPAFGSYGLGMIFFPPHPDQHKACRQALNHYIDELGFELLGYRKVPVDNSEIGATARAVEPRMEQVFIRPRQATEPKLLERRLVLLRKHAIHQIYAQYPQVEDDFYIASLSYKTVVYKGQLTATQLGPYFPDLSDPAFRSTMALVHSRFSTNTLPKWKLAQPFRVIAHNGEINTITGNVNSWIAREPLLQTSHYSAEELKMLKPICGKGLSDSGNFDNVLEFLVQNDRSIPHALMMMIPEAWQHDSQMKAWKRAFYQYHENLMEPWDGPAFIGFSDGILIGATLDRNGLRPGRYVLTEDKTLIAASEAGVIDIDPASIVLKGRLQAGKMLIADLEEQRIIGDEELKQTICQRLPYRDWLDSFAVGLKDLPTPTEKVKRLSGKKLLKRQQLFGYTKEDLRFIIAPMIQVGKDPIGSMGNDTPLAVLSQFSQHPANYFKQLFAQVTNPPIDPIRERSYMSLHSILGSSSNILDQQPEYARSLRLKQPVLKNKDLARIKANQHPYFKSSSIPLVYAHDSTLEAALDQLCAQAERRVREGCNLLLLSDREASQEQVPVPTLLAVGAIHHHLIDKALRMQCALIVEGGDVREVQHFATLISYGADAINPYVALDSIAQLKKMGILDQQQPLKKLTDTYIKAVGKGLLKVMSKIGISTLHSYKGAQIFEILGLNSKVVKRCFRGTISRIEGIGFEGLEKEIRARHRLAYSVISHLEEGGLYQWRQRGEYHLLNPQSIHLLQHATQGNQYEVYKKYARLINRQSEQACTLRGLLEFKKGPAIPIEEVEPVEHILRRFATGAMSFGSISHEAHSTLAIAMNRIGGKSNSGEGGEDESRYQPKDNGDSERSATKQVASGRFGVTSYYLSQADELQIKMAQGAKPGEGGQLPGHKVDAWIGRVRHSTPGVGLISPPPHHDIYSIEDLAQLIFDLKNANREARINVKLVSKAGVGIIASGVAKAHADAILISGHDGGTGASPLTSIRHAGLPWELGLAEAQQTLLRNKLRDRVTLQTDGQLRTGRDLAIATLLGAEEWGIATAALIVEGCIMMRKCHLNTCPVGIATQDPKLRKRFAGKVEHLINFFTFLAQDLREIMAQLGFRTVNEMVGRVDKLQAKPDVKHWKYQHLDLSPILHQQSGAEGLGQYKQIEQDHGLEAQLDWKLIEYARPALEEGRGVQRVFSIKNTDRAVGTMLSHEISRRYQSQGLPEHTIQFRFRGSAGQSFAAFGANGLLFTLEGEANDYFGKGLSGARLIACPDREASFEAHEHIIIGNVALYGATSGTAYIKGQAGERFAVRNSGVVAVVEGIGDHGCEYMTGGTVLVLGSTGRNFAAGMSGGIAYIYDQQGQFAPNCNMETVELEVPQEEDLETIRKMVRDHFHYTSSSYALDILNSWDKCAPHFIKVMPKDYKAALARKQDELSEEATPQASHY
ncbi:MAG: glutamate synthase large subunit [Bacteroidota bacterium]